MNLISTFLSGPLTDMISSFLSGVPKFMLALVILIIGYIVSKIISKIVKRLLKKVNIDKLGDQLNEIDIVSKANIKLEFSSILSSVVYYTVFIFFLIIAADTLQMQAVTNLVSQIFLLIPKLLVALVLLVVGILFSEIIRKVVFTALKSLGIPSANLIATFLFYFLFINFALSALKQAQINTEILSQNISILIAGIVFAFAIGYGLASKSVVANFLASFYSKGKINIGDRVTLDGITGQIIDISPNSISIKTADSVVVMPMSVTSKEKIEIHNN